jgi:hypothetical protein
LKKRTDKYCLGYAIYMYIPVKDSQKWFTHGKFFNEEKARQVIGRTGRH